MAPTVSMFNDFNYCFVFFGNNYMISGNFSTVNRCKNILFHDVFPPCYQRSSFKSYLFTSKKMLTTTWDKPLHLPPGLSFQTAPAQNNTYILWSVTCCRFNLKPSKICLEHAQMFHHTRLVSSTCILRLNVTLYSCVLLILTKNSAHNFFLRWSSSLSVAL